MEKKMYFTFVKDNHKLGKDDFVLGRIVGIRYAMLSLDRECDFAMIRVKDGVILPAECTAEQYEQFKNVIEDNYPDLCIFDYKEQVEN